MKKVNSAGKLSRIFAVFIAIFPLLFAWVMFWLAGREVSDVFSTIGFYIVLVIYFILISVHFHFNLFDYDVYVTHDEVILKRYLFPSKVEKKSIVHVESNWIISIFLLGFILKAENRTYLFKKTPKNLKERLNPDLVLRRIEKELLTDSNIKESRNEFNGGG